MERLPSLLDICDWSATPDLRLVRHHLLNPCQISVVGRMGKPVVVVVTQLNGIFVVFSGSLPVKPGANRVQYIFNLLFDCHGGDI